MKTTTPPGIPRASCNLSTYEPSLRGLLLRDWEKDAEAYGPEVATILLSGPDQTSADPETEDFQLAIEAREAAIRRLVDSFEIPKLREFAELMRLSVEQALAFAIDIMHQKAVAHYGSLASRNSAGTPEAARKPDEEIQAS